MRKNSPFAVHPNTRCVSFIFCFCLLLTALVPRTGAEAGVKKRRASAKAAEAAAPARPPAANPRRRAAEPTGPKTVGQWSGLKQLEDVPVHISLLPDGRLLYWGRDKAPDTWDAAGGSWSYVWNPETNQTQRIFNHTTNLFCSGHSFMSDGRLLVTGGHERHPDPTWADIEGIGEVDVNIFDHVRNSWTLAAQMPRGRWYPFNVTLASGETAILSGSYWVGTYHTDKYGRRVPKTERNKNPEIFTRAGTLRQFDTASSNMKNYPYLHLAPNGNVLIAGPVSDELKTSYFDPEANGGQGAFSVVQLAFSQPFHNEGSAVMYDSVNGKVLMVGGTGGSFHTDIHNVPEARTIDLTNSPTWQFVSSMNYRRKFHTATLLADGKVLVTGGTQCNGGNNIDCPEGAARSPELWDPQAPQGGWSVMAPNPSGIPRVYHSVALLLPDARVLVGGGGLPLAGGEYAGDEKCIEGQINASVKCRTSGHKDAEIFSPPYLFDNNGNPAPRPVIETAPRDVSYNTRFSVTYSGPTNVDKVTWIRLPSVTHGFNQDQRIVVFEGNDITPDPSNPNKLSIKAPADPRQCPPGHYMMFALSAGVPSVAKIVRVSGDQPSVSSRVARNLDGKLMVFYRGSDNALHYFAQTGDAPDGPWSQPISLTGGLASDPVAVANADGRIQVFAAIAGDGRIYSRTQTVPGAGTWSDWTAIPNTGLPAGEQFVSEPVAVRNWDGPLQLFARTSPGNLLYYTVQLSPGGAFDQWRPMSGAGISSPNVGVNRDGRVQLFVLGSDYRVWHRTQTVPGSAHTWTNWGVLPNIRPPCPTADCTPFTAMSKPTVARNDDGRLEVYARGTDNQMYIAWQTAPDADASWVWAWQPTGLAASNYPSVAPDAEGRLQVFVRSQSNDVRFRRQLSANTSGLLQSPVNLGGVVTTPPHVIRRADGRLEVFVRGSDNQLHRNWQLAPGGAAWSGWQALGGSAANF